MLIPSPYWVSYPKIAKLAGGRPVFVETDIKNDFKLTAENIVASATPYIKLLIPTHYAGLSFPITLYAGAPRYKIRLLEFFSG